MDAQTLNKLILRTVQPAASVSSLASCAKMLGSSSREDLCAFLTALCQMDIGKAAAVAHQLSNETSRQWAKDAVHEILSHRCQTEETVSPMELLAIATFFDTRLLQAVAPFLTTSLIRNTFFLADGAAACKLLHMGLICLSEEPYALIREAFFAFLQENSSHMDKGLSHLLPALVEKNAHRELSVLLETIGQEKIRALYDGDLFPVAESLILSDNGSLPLWEIYFAGFFSQPHTPEELETHCIAPMQQYADTPFFGSICTAFYLSVAAVYGPDHPAFDAVIEFVPPKKLPPTYTQRYQEQLRPLWDRPMALSHFLDRTAPGNPFRKEVVQGHTYTLLKSGQNQDACDRLCALFTHDLPMGIILNIFFSTDLRQKLPLEDVFALAKQHDRLPELLEVLKDVPFRGAITKQRTHLLVLTPFFYFVSGLQTMPMCHQIIEHTGNHNLTNNVLWYNIVGFNDKVLELAFCKHSALSTQDAPTWADAIEELESVPDLMALSPEELRQLSVTGFSMDSFGEENDLDLLTRLLSRHPEKLPEYLQVLRRCKWNAPFSRADLKTPGHLYTTLRPYQETAAELFRVLFESGQEIKSILDLYFSSIYKVILPLNKLLLMADREQLLELLPNYVIYCRVRNLSTPLCRLQNINCTPVCSMECMDGINSHFPFAAVITNFTTQEDYVHRIYLTPYRSESAGEKDLDSLFKYIVANRHINYTKRRQFAALPKVATWNASALARNLPRMEMATLLHKSDPDALMQLLQTVGEANPFGFQLNPLADRVYLEKLRPRPWQKRTIPQAANLMLLNAKDIRQVEAFYLHTGIKYYLTLPELAAVIQKRRPELVSQLPELFADVVFHAAADKHGYLWLPWVNQNTLRVSKEYADQVVHCRLCLHSDGAIAVTVLNAEISDAFHDILNACRLVGYHTTRHITTAATPSETEDIQWQIDYTRSLEEVVTQLREKLDSSQFRHKIFAKELENLIRKQGQQSSAEEMEAAIVTLTETCMQLHLHEMALRKHLFSTYIIFSRQYHSVSLGLAFCRLFHQYLPGKPAETFQKGVAKSVHQLTGRAFSPDMDVTIPQPQAPVPQDPSISFESQLRRLQATVYNEPLPPNEFAKQMGRLIRHCCDRVTAEEMGTAITELLEEWIPVHRDNPHLLNLLRGIYVTFARQYHTDSLGFALGRLAQQHLSEPSACALAQQIENAKAFLQASAANSTDTERT